MTALVPPECSNMHCNKQQLYLTMPMTAVSEAGC